MTETAPSTSAGDSAGSVAAVAGPAGTAAHGPPPVARVAGPAGTAAHRPLPLASLPGGAWKSAVHGPLGGFTRPLARTEFVVVDLETTGGSPEHAMIMEIGAVRVRGTEQAGDDQVADGQVFSRLINPGLPVPPHISALTGITGEMVAGAPEIGQVLPAFLRFAAGAVVVAHNAPFDLAFLASACAAQGLAWPAVPVLDTASVARRALSTVEAPDCRLGTLARVFGAAVPGHRALSDARATAAVLRGLIARLAALGVRTLDGVRQFTGEDAGWPPGPRRDRMLALTAEVPAAPGVCLFLGTGGEVLHVVKSSDMRARVRGYFAVSETRPGIRELLEHTERLCPLTQPTALAADVEEIRAIARHHPRFNDEPSAAAGAPAVPSGMAPQISGLAAARRVVAAGPRFDGGWDVAVIENGLLSAAAALPPGATPGTGDWPAGTAAADGPAAERACVLRWLGSPGVRLLEVDR